MQTQFYRSSGNLFSLIQPKGIQPSQTIVLLDSSFISTLTSYTLKLHSNGTYTVICLESYGLSLLSASIFTSIKSSSQSSQAADHSFTNWLPTFILQKSSGFASSLRLSFFSVVKSVWKMTDVILNYIKAFVHGYAPGMVGSKTLKSSEPKSETFSQLSLISVKSV